MPFDPAPQPTETKVGRFQHLADAMVRGAAITPLAICARTDGIGTCAIGAMHLGLGHGLNERLNWTGLTEEQWEMFYAYEHRYGTQLHEDSNLRRLTREQIAARIAAL